MTSTWGVAKFVGQWWEQYGSTMTDATSLRRQLSLLTTELAALEQDIERFTEFSRQPEATQFFRDTFAKDVVDYTAAVVEGRALAKQIEDRINSLLEEQ